MNKICPDANYLSLIAKNAGEVMIRNFMTNKHVEWKEDGSPVMAADKEISRMVIKSFARDYPHISIVTEEGSRVIPDAEIIGLCDPLDGTISYMTGVPFAAFSFVLLRHLDPIIAVIYEPFMNRLWIGRKGKLSTMNGGPISVSKRQGLKQSNLCILSWSTASIDFTQAFIKAQKAGACCISPATVSCVGGLLASGYFDGIMFPGESYWESIAIELLVRGAGGLVTDAIGEEIIYDPDKKMKGMIASNGLLHNDLFKLI